MSQIGWIGTDEAGKGDYFGPLVTAGVYVEEPETSILLEHGIRDSKRLSDNRTIQLAQYIRSTCLHDVVVIGPEKYNQLYDRIGNLNRLLAWAHARVIENLLEKTPCSRIISDQFGDQRFLENALMEKGRAVKLEQRTKAEDDIAVAAASIIARASFLHHLDKLSEKWGMKLPKGATNVIPAGQMSVQEHGKVNLVKIAKTHFKTTKQIMVTS